MASLRQVQIQDLLGRKETAFCLDGPSEKIAGHVVLVSGAGGSIGSELCRQIACCKPSLLVLLDHSEFNLYQIHLELSDSFPALQLAQCLVSVTDRQQLESVFFTYKPSVVFHAAAYKHVPLLENQMAVALRNNVVGSKNMADLSILYQVDRFVLVSTDKAVNPANIMGMTKRIAEIYCQSRTKNKTPCHTAFLTVRFGNVLGSAGSVVPLFEKQLQRGGPLLVTHPEMTRFFMTIPEASNLILQILAFGCGGDIYVLDMGESVKIADLAKRMIELAGKKPDLDIAIKYVGLRPGEKLYEELFYDKEALQKTTNKKVHLATAQSLPFDLVSQRFDILPAILERSEKDMLAWMTSLVPEYTAVSKQAVVETS